LTDQLVVLTGQSDTSACLLRLLLEEFMQVHPRYLRAEIYASTTLAQEPAAVLAIGDEALRLSNAEICPYPIQIDLGERWNQETGLPFVFAVCAVREDFLHKNRTTVRTIQQTLVACRDQGLLRIPEICRRAAPRIPMSHAACCRYFQSVEYDLNAGKQAALERFFTLLSKRGEANAASLPLKIFS
jgi:chorismate dehydratase